MLRQKNHGAVWSYSRPPVKEPGVEPDLRLPEFCMVISNLYWVYACELQPRGSDTQDCLWFPIPRKG